MPRKIGDVNGDGVVNTLDATFILSYLVNIPGYNLPDSEPITLVPGILHGEQNLGDGQPNVMRLIDYSDNSLHDLKVSDIKSKINFYINENDEIVLSCVENSTINGRDISGMGVVSMLFNIIDSSGVVNIQSDISLNFINNAISNSSIFTISGDISGTYIPSLDYPDDISYINNENTILKINNNNLVIGISSENVSSGYINKLLFTNPTVPSSTKSILLVSSIILIKPGLRKVINGI